MLKTHNHLDSSPTRLYIHIQLISTTLISHITRVGSIDVDKTFGEATSTILKGNPTQRLEPGSLKILNDDDLRNPEI